MKRRDLLLGLSVVPLAGTANALSWSDIKEAITGHTTDLIDRYTEDDAFAQVIHLDSVSSVRMM